MKGLKVILVRKKQNMLDILSFYDYVRKFACVHDPIRVLDVHNSCNS